jgi:hypothetical protein
MDTKYWHGSIGSALYAAEGLHPYRWAASVNKMRSPGKAVRESAFFRQPFLISTKRQFLQQTPILAGYTAHKKSPVDTGLLTWR